MWAFRIRWKRCRRQCHCHFTLFHSIPAYHSDLIPRCRDTWPPCCRTSNVDTSTKFANSISSRANGCQHSSACVTMRSIKQTTGKSNLVVVVLTNVFIYEFCLRSASTHFLPLKWVYILSLSAIFSINNSSIHPNSLIDSMNCVSFVSG